MPLDNRNLSSDIEEYMKGIPLDEECWRLSYELPHQTKVMIYDSKCKGCGFMHIQVGEVVLRSVEEAVVMAQMTNADIERSCDFPDDIQIINGEEVKPTLTEIVINGCRWWDKRNIEL